MIKHHPPHIRPKTAKFQIIIVSNPYRKRAHTEALYEFNFAMHGDVNIKHVSIFDALLGYRANMIILADDPNNVYGSVTNYEEERQRRIDWVNNDLRLKLAPGGLWINAI